MVKIIQNGNEILRQIAAPVSEKDFGGKTLKAIIKRMKEALVSQKDGVAIAAPQIAVPLRIFVVAGFMFRKKETDPIPSDRVFINPEITRASKEKWWMDEGCLSVRYLYGRVYRAKKTTVRAYDEEGTRFMMGGSNILAQIFQHEIDHLNGILFVDNAKDIHEMSAAEMEALSGSTPKISPKL
ncbi:MAG: peptide deformylase [Patescibacteria group bacterium]